MTCFTPLEHALLLDSGAVKADDGTQFAVCPACVSPEVAAIIDARFQAGSPAAACSPAAAGSSSPAAQSCAQHEERLVPNVAVLANSIIGPVLLMRNMPLTDLEQLLLTEVKALRPVTDADTQRIREDPSGGDDTAAQYQTALDLMALKDKAFHFLYFQMYAPCLEYYAASMACI